MVAGEVDQAFSLSNADSEGDVIDYGLELWVQSISYCYPFNGT